MNNNKKKTQQIESKQKRIYKESPKNMIGNVFHLFEIYRKLIELEFNNGISSAITAIVIVVIFLVFASFILLFLSIGAAILINRFMELSVNGSKGFFIIAGFYLVCFLILIKTKSFVKKVIFIKIQNLISKLIKR